MSETGAATADAPASAPERADDEHGLKNAPVTAALFAVNLGVFLAEVILAGDLRYALVVPEPLLRWLGANASAWTIADTRIETLVTSCFLHTSVLHLGLNLLLLYDVGRKIERRVGSARFFPLYLAAGIAGSAASAIWGRFVGPSISVGASGAICGLIGAAIVFGVRSDGWRNELSSRMGVYAVVLLLVPLLKHLRGDIAQVDNAAHVFGALAGAMVATSWRQGFVYSKAAERVIFAACALGIAASGVVVYVRDHTDPYLFMNVDQRVDVARQAFFAGNCEKARDAMHRAKTMDPSNYTLRRDENRIDIECNDGAPPSLDLRR